MKLSLSDFGARFTRATGALELMDDLGRAMSGDTDVLMLGGGNPGRVPAVQTLLGARLVELARSQRGLDELVGRYAHPRGEATFRAALARLLRREHGFDVTPDHIALTAGSQAAFFALFNMLAGPHPDGAKRILFPMTPEYVGYADLGLADSMFTSRRPAIEQLEEPYFKYRVDVASLDLDDSIAAVCVSRPTNPTGNVLTDAEMLDLERACRSRGIPLIVDGAYGLPFPGVVYTAAELRWSEDTILCLSLSKLGLPGVRTGIVVARPDVVDALTRINAVVNLAVGSVGPVMLAPFVEDGRLLELCRGEIRPFYAAKRDRAAAALERALAGLPARIHRPEGAFFLWLWFAGLPISSAELYARLKARGVVVLAGHYFFPGLDDDWIHRDECLRISYAQDDASVAAGIAAIGDEVRRVYAEAAHGAAP